ncbi:MAG: GatB/YqeY domain-containing protein [Deltaproteobacteria bacterium]|nr:GatB/YqeY domain-containing protein [Deltaproteobacteria bacterium]
MSDLSEGAIQERLKEAMRARATDRVLVLRGLVAAIKNLKIERRGAGAGDELAEADIAQIVRREIKQREEALTFAEQAGRTDLVEKNRGEKGFLERFLPQGPSAADLAAAIARHHAAGATSIGALMAKLKADFGAGLDGKVASEAVRGFLRDKGGA